MLQEGFTCRNWEFRSGGSMSTVWTSCRLLISGILCVNIKILVSIKSCLTSHSYQTTYYTPSVIHIQDVKKRLQALRGYEPKSPSQHSPETSDCWHMGDVRVISTADALCGSHAFQHNFQLFITQRCALYWKFLVWLKSPDRHSLLIALIPLSHWSALNTPKPLGVPTAKNPED
jgi:hypothetical protein